MPESSPSPSPQRLQGLDALALAGVLTEAVPPFIPGWETGEPLGAGGLGMVWMATRTGDGLIAAIKVPRADDIVLIERLEVEAAALGALDHPNIVRLLETGPLENGSLYLAMEYVDGPPLSHAIPAGGFSPARSCELFREVAAAVIHAHGRGVLHRDLKPGNILIDAAGHARVADFGLAHSVAGRVQRLSLTQAGLVAGTAEYLPPEAYRRGYEPDVAADVYALGVILYELLTGSPPRGAWSPVSLRKKDADIRLDDLVRRALEPDPARRFPNVQAMTDELEHILRTPPRYAGTPRLTRPVRLMDFLWTALGLFLFFGTLGLVNRIEKYDIGLPVDLIGRNSIRIGTYQAILLLLVCALPFGLWQLFRLWHFRRVPLRESLPAPFGLKLGTTRTAGAIVLLSQVLFLLAPLACGAYAWRERCMNWLEPASAPWVQGLVVTEGYRGLVAHDPWDWPEPGREYSLRERSGWLTDPLSRQDDHTDFIPGLIPRLIAGLALFCAAVVILTILAALARWWRFRKWGRSVALLALIAGAHRSVQAGIHKLRASEQKHLAGMMAEAHIWNVGFTARLASDVLHAILDQNLNGAPFPVDDCLHHLAPTLQCGDQPPAAGDERRAALARYAATFFTPHRHLEGFGHETPILPGEHRFAMFSALEDCTDVPASPATAAVTVIAAYATMLPPHGIAIDRIDHHSLPLWSADPIPLTVEEAHTWATSLLTALHDYTVPLPVPEGPGLIRVRIVGGTAGILPDLFHPTFSPGGAYTWDPDPLVTQPATRDSLIATLYNACENGARPRLVRPPGPGLPRPGGRHRIDFDIEDRGQPATWTADLIHTAGRWQCVHMKF